MCRCGHSFVENPSERPRPRVMATNTGCFIWMFLGNFVFAEVLGLMSLNPPERAGGWDHPQFGWYFVFCGLPSLAAAILLARRKRFGYTLGMVLCGMNLLSIPFGTVIAIVLMTGLSKDRHLFEA